MSEDRHTGMLACDRVEDSKLDTQAKELLALAAAGDVLLYQRRLSADRYEYHALTPAGVRP